MNRREAIEVGAGVGVSFLVGGVSAGVLALDQFGKEIEEKDEQMREQLTFDDVVNEIDREIDMLPGDYEQVELTGSHPVTGEPRRFEYRVEAAAPVDVFMMGPANLAKYIDDMDFEYIEDNSSLATTIGTGSGLVRSTFWYLVVDNTADGPTSPIAGENHVRIALNVWK